MDCDKTEKSVNEAESIEDLPYGWGRFRPGFLRFLNNPKLFLVTMMMYTLCAGVTMNGLLVVVLPTLEKRFSLTSLELGIIAAANDIVALGAVVIGFYGDRGNKIKWVGGGAATAGVGVLLFTLPHLVAGPYEPDAFNSETTGLCQTFSSNTTSSCDDGGSGGQHATMWYCMVIFVIAQLIHGAGICPLYSLVAAYLDENVEPQQMPIYVGLWYICAFLGPGFGALLGGQFLSVYVDVNQPEGLSLTPKDAGWIGAWWLGFLIFGLLYLLLAVTILGFPNSLPGAKERRQQHIKEGTIQKEAPMGEASFKEFFNELKSLFRNTTFVFTSLGGAVLLLFVYSLLPFLAKILQHKFNLDAVKNARLVSLILIPTATVGMLFGSYIVKKFALRSAWRGFLLYIAVCTASIGLFSTSMLLPACENANIAGVATSYLHSANVSSNIPLINMCNMDCRCSLKKLSPVCGSDNITYLNPCYAGCTSRLSDKTFVNCSCSTSTSHYDKPGTATPGYCDRDCKNLGIFLALTAFIILVNFSTVTPIQVIILRCVPDNKRSFANSMKYVLVKGIGLTPGPLILGHLLDMGCRLWQDICGEEGRCFDYDVHPVSRNICIFGIVCCGIATILYVLAWYYYKPELPDDREIDKNCNTAISNPGSVNRDADETNF